MPEWTGVVRVPADVAAALATRRPVVLFESAVVSHGLPVDVALQAIEEMTAEAGEAGALASTVAVLDGRITVGASSSELRRLTDAGAVKIAERDLPTAAALALTGGTTVSATVAIADLVGIPVVATGGIGGVHLGAEATWDVSADLPALAAHAVAVVSAGAKAICDVPKTLEYMETSGVTVVGFRTDRFPFFLAMDSGIAVPQRIETPRHAAEILRIKRALGQRGALLIANPIPAAAGLDRTVLVEAVERAQADARRAGTSGSDVTPFLLKSLASITHGASVRSNVALLRANARLAAEVAVSLQDLGRERTSSDGS